MRRRWSILAATLLIFFSAEFRHALAVDNPVFLSFVSHITKQVSVDKQAFVKASTCLSWFYHQLKKPKTPAVEGVAWNPTTSSFREEDCLQYYPGGMDEARNDFAKTQTFLSVSMTVYEFALVADHNDDQSYSVAELQDLFHALSLTYHEGEPSQLSVDTLTSRFDQWYRTKNLDDVMKGMNHLYERGYRVTIRDRAELDQVMK